MSTLDGGIVLDSVSKHYETPAGTVRAIDRISLEVQPGASLAITGPSGCGKSTLLGLISGLDTPTGGRLMVDGHEISALAPGQRARMRRRAFGLVYQADNLLPFLTAVENVGLQLALHGASDGYERCRMALALLGLSEQADKLPDQLSGGQRQRVAVARALIHAPRVILADEPTGSLDAENSATLIDLLLGAQAEAGATLVVVTHDPEVARRLDRTVAVRDGKLVENGGPAGA